MPVRRHFVAGMIFINFIQFNGKVFGASFYKLVVYHNKIPYKCENNYIFVYYNTRKDINASIIIILGKGTVNMLKGIPKIISPELLKVLCEMGHSDTIVLADGNFPAESIGKNSKVIRADGHSITDLLDAILKLFPLDTYVEKPVSLM